MKPGLRLLIFLLIAAVTVAACDPLDDLAVEEIKVQATTPPESLIPTGPAPTRRPVPTPLPTEELARPRSESPDPVATAEEMNQEEMTEEMSEEEMTEVGLESILAAHRAGLAVEALRATITNENLSSGESGSLLLEFVRPNSYRMVNEELELIVAAGQTFLMDKTTNWLISPGEQTERFEGLFDPFTDEQFVEAQLEALSMNIEDVRLVGEEPLNDILSQVFTYSEQPAGDEAPVQTTVWIGSEDGLLYRQVITFVLNNENYQHTTAFEYSDSIHVEPPLP
jgi:hypothetical protein